MEGSSLPMGSGCQIGSQYDVIYANNPATRNNNLRKAVPMPLRL